MGITEAQFNSANQCAAMRKALFPAVVSACYDARIGRVLVALESGLELAFSPRQVDRLRHARPHDLADLEISPSGLGIHFPHLDEDLYLPALLEGFLGSRRWMASEMGKRGGKAKTQAKAAAARKNGKLGGRPRKLVARD